MNVSDNHQKHLQVIKTKEGASAAAATTANSKATRRRRSLLNREVSNLNNSSVEVAEYHAQELAAVPFVWESSPGTPKRHVPMKSSCHDINRDLLPPLTPPPSYQYHNKVISTPKLSKKKSQKDSASVNNLIQSMFPRLLSIKRDHLPRLSSSSSTKSSSPTSSTSSSSSSSSSSQSRFVGSTPSPVQRHRQSFEYSSPEVGEEEDEVGSSSGSPVSTMCFRRLSCCNRVFHGL